MCLFTNQTESLIAKTDITCYKVVIVDVSGKLYTPFQEQLVEFNKKYTSTLELHILDKDRIAIFDYYRNSVGQGLHAFCTKKDAITFIRRQSPWYFKRCESLAKLHYIECTIPKDSKIVVGIYCAVYGESVYNGITSDTIIYGNKLEK